VKPIEIKNLFFEVDLDKIGSDTGNTQLQTENTEQDKLKRNYKLRDKWHNRVNLPNIYIVGNLLPFILFYI